MGGKWIDWGRGRLVDVWRGGGAGRCLEGGAGRCLEGEGGGGGGGLEVLSHHPVHMVGAMLEVEYTFTELLRLFVLHYM